MKATTPSLKVRLTAGLVFINAFVFLLAGAALYQNRRQYEQRTELSTQNLARSLELNVAAILDKVDLAVFAVATEAERQLAGGGIQAGALNGYIRRECALIPSLDSIRVADPNGILRYGMGIAPNSSTDITDRDYFRRHAETPGAGLVISKPVISRVNGKWVIMLARRIDRPDGGFAGIAYGAVPLDTFTALFAALEVGPHGALSLRDQDLGIVVRHPETEGKAQAIGNHRVSPDIRSLVSAQPGSGTYSTEVRYDGIDRTISYRRVGRHPYYIFVGQATSDYLGPWWQEVLAVASLAALFGLITTAGAFGIHSRHQRELRALEELRLSKAELERYRDDLERLVRERTQEYLEARDTAETANRAKSVFLANMSHEIRTPMNAVIGLTYLALQTRLTDQQRQYLDRVQRAAQSLLGIINDILDFSKIEAGKLAIEAETFLLEDVLEPLTHLVALRCAGKPIDFLIQRAPDVPGILVGDALRLGQVLSNLCINAVKFTERGEVVLAIAVRSASPGQVELRFSVSDTGIGMSPEQVGLLFQPFTQVDASSTRRFGGTGLGLAISHHLVALMGGTIQVKSEPGAGSSFSFTARLGRAAGEAEPVPALTELPGLRLLVVEPSATGRAILLGLARDLGCRPVATAGTEAGLAALRQEAFDVLLVDGRLPDLDRFQVAGSLPGRDAAPRFIRMSPFGEDPPAGMAGFLAKPVTSAGLREALLAAFGRGSPAPAQAQAVNRPEDWPALLRGTRVLLVEDNEFNRQVAFELLALMGVEAVLAGHGQEALERVRAERFDAVLMDLQMPVMDGYEATRRLRSDPANDGLPILAMTAHAMAQERGKCLAMGMNDYITKPIQPEQLAATLGRWIQGPGATAEPAQAIGHAPTAGQAHATGQAHTTEQAHAAGQAQAAEHTQATERAQATVPTQAPAPVPPPAPAGLPGLDWAEGLANFSGDLPLFEKMLGRFLELKPRVGEEIRACLGTGDGAAAYRLAHSMISAAGTIGAGALAASALALQEALNEGPLAARDAALARFEADLEILMASLHRHFADK